MTNPSGQSFLVIETDQGPVQTLTLDVDQALEHARAIKLGSMGERKVLRILQRSKVVLEGEALRKRLDDW